jgi:hypothetical protein
MELTAILSIMTLSITTLSIEGLGKMSFGNSTLSTCLLHYIY